MIAPATGISSSVFEGSQVPDNSREIGLVQLDIRNMRQMILLATLLFLPSQAMAVSKELETACASDYASYCSPYKVTTPPSASLTACMRSHRHQLLERCIRALGNSGLVSRHDIEEYKRERGIR
jgi:hypothetical protein